MKLSATDKSIIEKAKASGRVEVGGRREMKAASKLVALGLGILSNVEMLTERTDHGVKYYSMGVFKLAAK